MSRNGPYAEELRGAIDQGQTAGKTSFPDPAAAPLGTDDEAAGAPVHGERTKQALHDEVRARPQAPAEGSEPRFWPSAIIVVLIGIVAAIAIWGLLSQA